MFASWSLGFHQHHNDFWDIFHAAARLDGADRGTWFNGQYPVAYTLLLRLLMAGGHPVASAIIINILLAGATLLLLAALCRDAMTPPWALLSVLFLAAFREFFRYATAGGGDPGAALLFTAGCALLLRELLLSPERFRPGRFVLAGLLMGGAGLFRYHAFVGGALWVAALAAALPGRRRAGLLLAAGLCAGYSPQWVVNLLAGRGLFETGFGPMNVYDLMHGINWQRSTDLTLPSSAFDVVAADPGLFLRRYAAAVWSFKQLWLPPLLAIPLASGPVHRRAFIILALWGVAYFGLFSATTSGRQGLLALPLSMFALGYVMQALWKRVDGSAPAVRRGAHAALALGIALFLALHVLRDARGIAQRAELRRDAVSVEAVLLAQGARSAAEVFTTDYDLYFPRLGGLLPRFNGGAVRLGTDWYNAAFPEFPADSPAAFLAACRARGVRFVVLNTEAENLSAWMGELYRDRGSVEGLSLHAETPGHRVYRVL